MAIVGIHNITGCRFNAFFRVCDARRRPFLRQIRNRWINTTATASGYKPFGLITTSRNKLIKSCETIIYIYIYSTVLERLRASRRPNGIYFRLFIYQYMYSYIPTRKTKYTIWYITRVRGSVQRRSKITWWVNFEKIALGLKDDSFLSHPID